MRAEYERWIRGRVVCAGLVVVGACSDRPLPGDDASELGTMHERDEADASTGELDSTGPMGADDPTAEPIGSNPGGGNALAHFNDYGLELFLSNSTAISCDDPYAAEVCEEEPIWTFSIWLRARPDFRGRWEKDEGWIATWHDPPEDDGTCTWTGGYAVGDPSLVIEAVDDELVIATIAGMIPDPGDGSAYSGDLAAHICD